MFFLFNYPAFSKEDKGPTSLKTFIFRWVSLGA